MSIGASEQLPGLTPSPYWLVHEARVRSIAWAPGGRSIATGTVDGTIHIWKVTISTSRLNIKVTDSPICGLAWSGDGRRLASLSIDGFLHIWDARDGALLGRKKAHKRTGSAVVWQPDGPHVATAGFDCFVHVWDANSPREAVASQHLRSPPNSLAWGLLLASGCADGSINFLRENWEPSECLFHANGPVRCLAWSADVLASSGIDKQVRVWGKDRLIASLEGHIAEISGLSFSSDGRLLASKAETIRLWRTDTWDCVATISHLPSPRV